MKVLVIGSGGNLGTEFTKVANRHFDLVRCSKNPKSTSEYKIDPFYGISTSDTENVEIIVNFANAYFPTPNSAQNFQMYEAIIGVAKAIQIFNADLNIPVISFASYFQFAPQEMQPWSIYSQFKDEASTIYRSMESPWTEVVLRDNFGGIRTDKFLERALVANSLGIDLDATPGNSLINLIHIQDICEYLLLIMKQKKTYVNRNHSQVELRSEKSYSLRELISMVDAYRGRATKVNWGAYPYREHEVFQEWISAPLPLTWKPKRALEDYIRNFQL